MKTERRHELQTNVLADKVAHWIEVAEPHGRAILLGIAAAFALLFVYLYMSAQQAQRLADGWDHYFEAFNAQDGTKLNATAESYPHTPVSDWARLMTADMLLAQSIERLFTDKADAREEIRRAADLYQTARNSDEPVVVERATFGLARAHESLGELQKAQHEYEAVAKNRGPYAGLAAERARDLSRPETKELYDWLAKFKPQEARERPDKKPDFMNESLERSSELRLPSSITDKIPAAGSDDVVVPKGTAPPAETDKPASDAPTIGEGKPAADGKPPADKPAAEPGAEDAASKPAADGKPAVEKPADAKPAVPAAEQKPDR